MEYIKNNSTKSLKEVIKKFYKKWKKKISLMENYQHKILSWLIVFSVILSLISLCFVLIDLNDIWKDLTEHQQRIKNLEILTLRRIGVKIWTLITTHQIKPYLNL